MKPSLFASVSFSILLVGCHNRAASPPADNPVAAQVITVTTVATDSVSLVSGIVRSRLEADLSAQIVAPVMVVTKREGDRFRSGEVLIRLRSPALNAGVAQSEAALQVAQYQAAAAQSAARLAAETLARYGQLRERHSVTAHELEQVEAQSSSAMSQRQSASAQVQAAEAAIALQKSNAADALLRAPFDGVVTRRVVDPGAMAMPGLPLLHLQSLGVKEVEFSAPEETLSRVHVGLSVPVSSADNRSAMARIDEVAPASDPGSHSFVVRAVLMTQPGWNCGAVVQVGLPASGETGLAISVPSGALLKQGGLDAVLVDGADGRAQVRYVTIGEEDGGRTRILSGLQAGEHILASGNVALAGKRIEVRP